MALKNLKLAGALAVAAVTLPASVYATTANVDATARFLDALVLNAVAMDFGTVEFAAAPAGGDTATLGTNGVINYAGNFAGSGTGTAGQVQITSGADGETVEVFCDTTATMVEGVGLTATIDVVAIEVVSETTGPQAPGSGSACGGVGAVTPATTMVLDIGGGTADTFFLGGQIDGATASGFVAGTYSTANAGGDDIQVDINYQ